MSTFSNICIFCSRDCIRTESLDSESDVLNKKRKAEILHQFVKLTERYLNTSFHLNTLNGNKGVLESCQDCFILVDSFCNLYHQLKCLEMELEWKLRVLSDAINSSKSKNVTSRFSSQCSSEGGELSEVLENFRTDFQQKCIRKLAKCFPKVSLNRWKDVPANQKVCHLNNQTGGDFNQLFVSWVSTLAVVFQLGFGNRTQTCYPEGSGGQYADLISECNDDDDNFEVVQHREDLSSHDITDNNSEWEIGYPAASDNHFVEVSKLESSEFKKPVVASQPDSNDLIKVRNRKRKGLQKYYSKRRHDLPPKPLFRCSLCCRNFRTLHHLQRHRRAFTHLLMKRKSLGQSVNPKQARTTKRQIQKCNKTGTNNEDKNENVGVLRPLRIIKKPRVANEEYERNSEANEQDSLFNAADDDDWNLSSSDGDDSSSSSSESISSSSSSGSISSDEEEERPCPATPKLEVPTDSYSCTSVGSCLQSFYFKEELDDHLQLHGSFPCSICDVVEEYAPDLALHESDHMKQTKTEDLAEESEKKRKTLNVKRNCARCSFSTEENFRYINHYLESHLDLPTQRIKCRICNVWTKDRRSFTLHMKNFHKRKTDGSSLYKCEQCPANFVTKIQLLKHQKNHPEIKKEKNYFCDEVSCNARFETESELVLHKRLHGDFTCKFCSSVENHAENLAIHELSHGQSESESFKYSCPRCPLHTISKKNYISHFALVHLRLRSSSVPCSICQVPLLTGVSKKRHFLRQHDTRGVDPKSVIKCKECTAYFLKSRQLEAHKKEIHSSGQDLETCATLSESSDDEEHQNTSKHYRRKCTKCGSIFVCLLTLRKHKETCKKKDRQLETITNQFSCEVGSCKHSFNFKEELEIHQKHHGNFPCQSCKIVKTFAPDLVFHEISHSGEKCKTDKTHFKCARCSYKVLKLKKRSNINILNHYLSQHFRLPIQLVMCSICKVLYTKESLKPHHKNFHNVEGVDPKLIQRCEQCDAYFLKSTHLTEHIKKAHNSKIDQKLIRKCDVDMNCRKTFESEEDLEIHRKLHGKFTCSVCPVVENYAPNLAVHETTHVESDLEPSTCSLKGVGRGQPYSCLRCSSVLHGRFQYVTHFLEIHLKLPSEYVTCQNCGDKCSDMNALRAHFNLQHKSNGKTEVDKANCDQCPAFFFKPFQLAAHKKKMHGDDNSTCVDCGRKFPSANALRSHRATVHKTNEADFPHACNIQGCERRFENATDLVWHKQMLHDGKGRDKTMICHECGKKLSHKSALISHMRLHQAGKIRSKGKNYVCEECGKFFNSEEKLKIHKLSHTGPASWEFACIFCDKKSATKQRHMEHLRAHTNEKPYVCEYCGAEYTQLNRLRDHKNKKHDANDRPQKRKIVNGQPSKKGQKLPRLKK